MAEFIFITKHVGNSYDVEKMAHLSLSKNKVGGEWFDCSKGEAIDSVLSAIDSIGIPPEIDHIGYDNYSAEERMLKWKKLGCSVESLSMANYKIVEAYMKVNKDESFASLSHEVQYLIASTEFAKQYMTLGFKEVIYQVD
jgi:hypothetical protein